MPRKSCAPLPTAWTFVDSITGRSATTLRWAQSVALSIWLMQSSASPGHERVVRRITLRWTYVGRPAVGYGLHHEVWAVCLGAGWQCRQVGLRCELAFNFKDQKMCRCASGTALCAKGLLWHIQYMIYCIHDASYLAVKMRYNHLIASKKLLVLSVVHC